MRYRAIASASASAHTRQHAYVGPSWELLAACLGARLPQSRITCVQHGKHSSEELIIVAAERLHPCQNRFEASRLRHRPPPTSRASTSMPSRVNAGSVSRPKLATMTSKVTRCAVWVNGAPSKSKPMASAGHSCGLDNHRKRASRSIKRWMSQALATRSTHSRCRVAQRFPR